MGLPGSVPALSDATGYVDGAVDPRKPARRVNVSSPRGTGSALQHERQQPEPAPAPAPEPEPAPESTSAPGVKPKQSIKLDQEQAEVNASVRRARAECMALVPSSTENLTTLEVQLLAKLDELSTMLCDLAQSSEELLVKKNQEIRQLRAAMLEQQHCSQVDKAIAQPPVAPDASSLGVTDRKATSSSLSEGANDSDGSDSADEHWAMHALNNKATQRRRMAVEFSSLSSSPRSGRHQSGGSIGPMQSAEANTVARLQASIPARSCSQDLARKAGWTSLEQRAWAIAGQDAKRLQRIVADEQDDEDVEEGEPPAPPG